MAIPLGVLASGYAVAVLGLLFAVDLLWATFLISSWSGRLYRLLRIPAPAALAAIAALLANPWAQVADYVLQGAQTIKADPEKIAGQVEAFLADFQTGGVKVSLREDHPAASIDAQALARLTAWAAEMRAPALAEKGLDLDRTVPARLARAGTTMVLLNTAEMGRLSAEDRIMMVTCEGSAEAGFSMDLLPEVLLYGQDSQTVPVLAPIEEACRRAMDMDVTEVNSF